MNPAMAEANAGRVERAPAQAGSTCRILRSFTEAEPLRSQWDALVLRSGADVYQTHDWCRLWWKYYGKGRELHLLCWFSGEELVGLMPAFVETLWLGLIRLRVAKLVGSDFSLQLCNLPILPEIRTAAAARAMEYFLGELRCDVLLVGPLSGAAAGLDGLLAAAQGHASVATAESLGASCNTYFELPGKYEDYLRSIGKQQSGNLNRTINQLCKGRRVVFDVVQSAADLVSGFDAFCALHEIQWKAEGKLGHFGDWPQSRAFNRELVEALGAKGFVRFFRILADDHVLSSQYCFLFGGTNYWRLPARECGAEWDRLSMGRMGLARMIESTIAQGGRLVEGGRGHYAYKVQMGGREWPLRMLEFVRKAPGVAARVRLFRAQASFLNLAYYKVLFIRVAPRMPMLQRPLWPGWIRSTW